MQAHWISLRVTIMILMGVIGFAGAVEAGDRPNFLLVVADDLGWTDILFFSLIMEQILGIRMSTRELIPRNSKISLITASKTLGIRGRTMPTELVSRVALADH